MTLLDQLNPRQREAVEAVEGPVLILAGAGSGKTRVITYRIVRLIEDLGIAPDSILAVTFTNKAAAEMAERVDQLLGGRSLRKPLISTFHSFCVRVLRRDIEALRIGGSGYKKDFAIYDDGDQQSVVKGVMRRLGIDDKQLKPSAALSRISWAKNHMLDPQEMYLQSADPLTEKIAHIFEVYRKELRTANALDFDDLLLETVRLLKSSAEVRERYQRRFEYLLIDEYQDTNRPQYELIKLLAGGRHNLCVVGDEDQSIYSWRGADIRNILEFERDFPEARVIRLEQNYRSTQFILEAASAVVANNVKRKGKTLWTAREGGTRVGYYEAPDGENESLFAADYISRYLKKASEAGAQREEARIAVLYRLNSQSRLLEEAMRRYQLPYQVVGGFSFYERAEIKDMIGYLKLINNPQDSVALLRVINTPARGIGKTTMETLERLSLETGMSLWSAAGEALERKLLPPRACAALAGFKQLIDDARSMLAGSFVERVSDTAREENTDHGDAETRREGNGHIDSDVAQPGPENNDTSFDFGLNSQQPLFSSQPERPLADARDDIEFTPTGVVATISEKSLTRIKRSFERLAKKASSLKINPPELVVRSLGTFPVRYKIGFSFNPPEIRGWKLLGILHHRDGKTEAHPMAGQEVPVRYQDAGPDCDHCKTPQRRKDTFILENEAKEVRQVGSKCLQDFFGGLSSDSLTYFSDAITQLKKEITEAENDELLDSMSVESQVSNQEAGEPRRGGTQENETAFNPADFGKDISTFFGGNDKPSQPPVEGFRAPGGPATVPEILKFLIDRTGYIKQLEEEATPDSFARIENLRELVNAAMDSRDRGETLAEFLDHAALVSDVDTYDPRGRITLMTLHSAKGLEFNLVLLIGMEEGLFPHSRAFNDPEQMEEERRLCYVGMTRAMDQLILSRARFRRRYGTDMPDASVPSRFLEEVPPRLLEDVSRPGHRKAVIHSDGDYASLHYNYEDEDQSAAYEHGEHREPPVRPRPGPGSKSSGYTGPKYNSIENIAEFFASRGKKFPMPKLSPETGKAGKGATAFRPGQRVRHPKYGEGVVYQREGEGESAKITVQFPRFGLKKLVEKYAQLERA